MATSAIVGTGQPPASAIAQSTFALVAFGGRILDAALATDFVMISKKFMEDGLQPTCLSSVHLHDITSWNGPFLFGREDLRERVRIYDSAEAMQPFYRLETRGLKSHILDWVKNVSSRVRRGDRIIIVLIAHGNPNGCVTLFPQHAEQEFLSTVEMKAALSVLPANIRLLLVNEACYSGGWTSISPEIGAERDVLVETAATHGQPSWEYSSGSGRNRCSVFGAAFVEEITTWPEGQISHHRTRIVDEMRHVRPDQPTSDPLVVPSPRTLPSHNFSHFLLNTKIARAILKIASTQERHEGTLQSRTSARTFWRRLRGRFGGPQEPAQALGDGSPPECSGTDMKAHVMRTYLKDLGPRRHATDLSTLATACEIALKGLGPPDLQDEIIATISWQANQMERVGFLLAHLAKQELITDTFDAERAHHIFANNYQDAMGKVADMLQKHNEQLRLMNPPTEGHVAVQFNDAQVWLIGVLAYNWLKYPARFELDRVENEVLAFFA